MEHSLNEIIEALAAMGKHYGLTLWADGSLCIHRPDKAMGEWVSLPGIAAELRAAAYNKGVQE